MKKNMVLLIATLVVLTVLAVAFTANAPVSEATESSYERLVTVNGEAKLKIEPNMAILSVSVQTENKLATAAASQNAVKMDAVIEALVDAGIDRDTISTEGYNLYEMTHWNEGQMYHDGYRVNNNIKFETMDIDQVGSYFDVAIEAGANSVNSPQFTLADQDQVKLDLLELAMENAILKADVLVNSAGAARGVVVTINENSISGSFYRTVDYAMEMDKTSMAGAVPVTPIQAGDLELSAYVTVTFAIQ